tara:strand:+ start:30145 stop:31608 length:1464 start_codon:yes stop_codon:yes gene_type:complete
MNNLKRIYKESLGLLTDFYQLTMSYGYFKKGMAEREAVFNLFFRSNPFSGGYTVMAGLSRVIDYLNNFKFSASDIDYLATLKDGDGNAYFDEAFLEYLGDMKFECTIDAQPDGSIIFPHEPVIRVKGPLMQCQILETPLLTIVGQAALIATKASRITSVTGDEPVMEFGLRRAQGIDGALTGSLSSYIGGCHSTSNVLAGKLFGIPVSGTHSHSWVMAFQSELEAFEAYADVMPGNCVLLVDTYNTLEGVKKAVKIGLDLKEKGKKLKAIRVDSGDLAYLSIEARKILDAAGLKDTRIVGSNDLDEYLIASLKDQGATITMWGVGTKLITSFDQPALGQVYKMTAIKNKDGEWKNRIKLSEQNIKINMPGILNVRRFFVNGKMAGDMIFDERDKMDDYRIIAPDDFTKRKKFGMDTQYKDLLKPIFEQGNQTYQVPSFEESRQYHLAQRNMLDASSRRLVNPHLYPVGLEPKLFERRSELIIKLRNR